jgi:hypothetical protein
VRRNLSPFGHESGTEKEWEDGWAALLGVLNDLRDEQLHDTVTIRSRS